MEELIKIEKREDGTQAVSARELHAFLEIKSKFSDWFKNRVSKYGFIENQDFASLSRNLENGGREIEYALSLDTAKELAMVEGNSKGKQARQYFIEAEKQLRKRELPQTYSQALRQLLSEVEQKKQAQHQVKNLNTALDNLHDWVSIIKVATHNRVPEKMFSWHILKAQSLAMGFDVKKAASPRFEFQNLYHVSAFKACYPQFRYDFI